MRHALALGAAAVLALTLGPSPPLAGNGNPFDTGSANVLTLAVYGDAPYGTTPTDTAESEATPAFIDSVNADPKVDLVLHVGDIHSGKQYCTQAYDQRSATCGRRSRIRWSTRPATTSGPTATRRRGGAATSTSDVADGQPGRLRERQPGREPRARPLDLLPAARRHARRAQEARALAGAGVRPGAPVRRGLRRERHVGAVEDALRHAQRARAARTTTPTPGTARRRHAGADRTRSRAHRRRPALARRRVRRARSADGAAASSSLTQADMWDLDGKAPAHLTDYEPFIDELAAHTTAFGKPVLLLQRRLARLPLGQPARRRPCASRPCASTGQAPRLRRAELPPHRRARQHVPAGVPAADDRPARRRPASANAFGPFSWTRVQP